ncbi:MAG: hypothetical protein QXW41_08035 [Fervidicoccaceae archaeon]
MIGTTIMIILLFLLLMILFFIMFMYLIFFREGGLRITEIQRDQEGRIQSIIEKGW